ncbi:protein of unknown function [Magnetospirillum gryphiswaldense MSR-1 v2]|uniref:Uncharacterized protein n=1 Tax=Magnetospirillum gryphiswaldense (strain DSM 6361 / JCM 21280 / NBRC 15271 / MSR-1) TaxID=431944 RepID=V6F749_MAGGM|nr:hypothetical protein [Magnetospirillum gryphiswaldense]CDL00151.1 protein of unknown function [Magnetospirillum gryphiswaldense MSR-1 v2]
MTWETGFVTQVEIKRLATQVVANISVTASTDDILRLCIGMALAKDLMDSDLVSLLAEVGTRLGLSLVV